MSGEMDDLQRLGILQAIYNELGKQLGTKDPTNFRGQVNAHLVDVAEQTGATTFAIRLGGEKVGTVSVTLGTDATTEPALAIRDREACDQWMLEQGYAHVETRVVYDKDDAALLSDGELPDGCELAERTVPGRAPRVTVRGCEMTSTRKAYRGVLEALGDGSQRAVLDALTLPDEPGGLLGGAE